MLHIKDNGGERDGEGRRKAVVGINFSDRRYNKDRRQAMDRRSGRDRRSPNGFRPIIGLDRRRACANKTERFSLFSPFANWAQYSHLNGQ